MKKKINNLIIITIILIIVVFLIILYIKVYKTDTFDNPETTNTSFTNTSPTNKQKPIDRTQLYGALFLENLDKTIKNLSNPDIKYEDNRIQLNNYSDILL